MDGRLALDQGCEVDQSVARSVDCLAIRHWNVGMTVVQSENWTGLNAPALSFPPIYFPFPFLSLWMPARRVQTLGVQLRAILSSFVLGDVADCSIDSGEYLS